MGSDEFSGKVVSVEFSTIAHATENLEKVEAAILNILPSELHGSISLSRMYLKGHHGNPIATFAMRIVKEKIAEIVVQHLFTMMSLSDKRELCLEFEKYFDEEGNFYIRLDKQEAFRGRIKLAREDPIRIKIKAKMWRRNMESVRETFRSLGMIE